MPHAPTRTDRDRIIWVTVFAIALAGVTVAVILQYTASIGMGRELMVEQSRTITTLLETEVANLGQYGSFRRERLGLMFERLVEIGAVSHLRLEDEEGNVQIEAGRAWGSTPPAEGVEIRRRIEIREPFAASHGVSPGVPTVGGPGSNPSGMLTGSVVLVLQFSHQRIEEIQRNTIAHLIGTLVLLVAFGATALLWMRATRRSAVAARQLRLAHERSEHLEGISVMASGLAHEIRNPIGAVHGFAQLLAERFPDDSPEGRYAGVMLKALEEVLERVTRLLSFARVQKPDRKAEDLDGLVSNVVRLISPDFEQKGVTLRADLRASRPEAMVDAAKVKEVVLNLVLNALDSLEPGGQVLVTTLYYSKEGAHIVSVSDSGEGIPPEVVEKVFRPYFTTKSKGSGLGLAICRRIVEDHGGTIILESEPGSGTTVTVSFPRTPAP